MTRHDAARPDRILTFVREHVVMHGYPPSIREIMRGVGLASTSSVVHHLRKLEEAGALERDDRARAIRLRTPDVDALLVEILMDPGVGSLRVETQDRLARITQRLARA